MKKLFTALSVSIEILAAVFLIILALSVVLGYFGFFFYAFGAAAGLVVEGFNAVAR